MTSEWGRVGQNATAWGPLTRPDREALRRLLPDVPSEAVLRTAEPGVTYTLTPGFAQVMPVWYDIAESATGQHRFVLLLPVDRQPILRDLSQLRKDLEAHHEQLNPNHPLLEELDWVVDQLLNVVRELHRYGQGIGLLEPGNVLWFVDREGKRRLVLPDVGFRWSQYGGVPDWVSGKVTRDGYQTEPNPYRPLWGVGKPEDALRRGCNVREDLLIVARLLDWLMNGGVAEKHFPDNNDTKHPVYLVLRGVHNGDITDLDGFKSALETPGAGTSAYFLRGKEVVKPKREPGRWKRPALIAALALLLMGAGGATFWYVYTHTKAPPAPSPHYPELPGVSKLVPLLDEFEKAKPDLGKMLEILDRMHKTERHANEAIRAKEEKCLADYRTIVREMLEQRSNSLPERLREDGVDQPAACVEIKRLLSWWERLTSLTPSDKEKPKCYNDVKSLSDDYGCR
jgi:hypothetical protein